MVLGKDGIALCELPFIGSFTKAALLDWLSEAAFAFRLLFFWIALQAQELLGL